MTNGLNLGIFRAEGGGAARFFIFLKHFILAEVLPFKEIIIVLLIYLSGKIANNKECWTSLEFPIWDNQI